ncbi:hypothetical protein Pmar_PMAR004315 [Perkinsus marinus ATCC 50983]|uniref:Uncharacterized protein n=1 Tax=Perkinsus marinus (strain ATCC 50983 / TXsc) TaxID=423536 RepID=C5K4F8_PERM5|nr:hypothetical protein Pmar_PMAR004315 [Perkinsus marinus ATCC 50983]EER20651.1 hypothetical protein Pmar_PMAR004315 [Perkinsus marinus ATCC 50983]|eukprot:XP_002788855.1 hypothetical protein Pmar_PMAR004315 [Perkinsus marinus ATCC 50983]
MLVSSLRRLIVFLLVESSCVASARQISEGSVVARKTELAQCLEKNEALEAQVAHLGRHVEAMSQSHADNLGGVHSELNQKIVALGVLERTMEDFEARLEACEATGGGERRLTEIDLGSAFDRIIGSVTSTRLGAAVCNVSSPILSAASGAWPLTEPNSSSASSYGDSLFNAVQDYLDEHINGRRLVLPSGLLPRTLLIVSSLVFSYVLTVTLLMLLLAPLKIGGLLLKH